MIKNTLPTRESTITKGRQGNEDKKVSTIMETMALQKKRRTEATTTPRASWHKITKIFKNIINEEARRQMTTAEAAHSPTRESAITRGWRGEKDVMVKTRKRNSCSATIDRTNLQQTKNADKDD